MLLIFSIVLFNIHFVYSDANMNVSVKAQKHDKVKLKIIFVGKPQKKIKKIASILKNDLEFSGQFEVILPDTFYPALKSKNDVTSLFSDDCRIGIFLSQDKGKKKICWRLYDLEYASMISGLAYKQKGKDLRGWAHNIADTIWPVLTNEPGFFSTKISYCKEVKRSGKKSYKHIYVSDYDGSNEKLLVSTPTINVVPRWNNDLSNPLVFYSEHTNENVRLVVVDMNKKRKIVSNFDGLNILSTFSPDGKKFAYCASRGDGFCQIYYYADGKLKKITNKGNNFSPTFTDNGEQLYFCSDALNGRPQIYKYDLTTQSSEKISKGGFNVSTSFSSKKKLLAYSRMVRGTMQIFTYDPRTKLSKQVTFGKGNKEECSWSPCGNYLLFSLERGTKSRVAMLHLLTGRQHFVTSCKDNNYYPAWSPIYAEFPSVR